MKKLYFIILFSISISASAQWDFIGLDSTYTSDLTIYGDTIYASTYNGIYKQYINTWPTVPNGIWTPCGMQGEHVVQTFVPDHNTFICLVEIDSLNRTQIYKSTNAGNSFNIMTTDTSAINSYQFLNAMAHPPGNYDTLYFLNHHLRTFNGGISWDTIHSQVLNDRFIAVNPNHTNQIIIGGETMAMSPYIQVSNDYGNTWSFPAMIGFFAGDNCVHDITFDLWSNGNWYASGEGVICESSDSGETWTQIHNSWGGPPNFSLYNWDIEFGHYGLYVTGSNSNAPEVPFLWRYYSNTWWNTESTFPLDSINPEMKCLKYIGSGWGDDVYLGGHGVYVYHIIIGGIEEQGKDAINIYPNPFSTELNIDLRDIPSSAKYTLAIYNSFGQKLKQSPLPLFKNIDLNNLTRGIYYFQLSDEKGNILKRSKNIKI